jgi:hypothetical protein
MSRKAAANIRGLALVRKFQATRSFALAASCVLSPSSLALQKIPILAPLYVFRRERPLSQPVGLVGGCQ